MDSRPTTLADHYHDVKPSQQEQKPTTRKERKAVKKEFERLQDESCRVEVDDLEDCRIKKGLFGMWRCRYQEVALMQCQQRYAAQVEKQKRNVEIFARRQRAEATSTTPLNQNLLSIYKTDRIDPDKEAIVGIERYRPPVVESHNTNVHPVTLYAERLEHSPQFRSAALARIKNDRLHGFHYRPNESLDRFE